MPQVPQVSVVMGVYNGAHDLPRTVRSVLEQDVDLELIVVDDGSTDATPLLLQELSADDGRIRVIRQGNAGLTRSLIRGCAAARGHLIARQDCGDASLPGRLGRQVEVLTESAAALVSCGVRFIGPNNERLYEVVPDRFDMTDRLSKLDVREVRGPGHHGSTIFRRSAYEQAGGYRHHFYFAQDLDLWMRLTERGAHLAIPDILYEARFGPSDLSAGFRRDQFELARLIIECAARRRQGQSESEILAKAEALRPRARRLPRNVQVANARYFIGMCLRGQGSPAARDYFRAALRANPLHVKAAMRLLLG